MRRIEADQIAVMSIHYQFYPLTRFLDTARRLNVSAVDLWAGYPHLLLDNDWESAARAVRAAADDRGLRIICCTPEQVRYPLNLASTEPKVRARTLEYLKRGVDAAGVLGAGMVQVVPGYGWYDSRKAAAWSALVSSLSELCSYAAQRGVTVLLEPLQIIESNLVNDRYDAQNILRDVGSDALKIVVATTHMCVSGESLEEYFDLLGDGIGHIHLNESDQVPWGQGTLDLGHFLRVLSRYDYDKLCTLEICSLPHYVDADRALQENVTYVQNKLAETFRSFNLSNGGKYDV